ncbi:DUF5916 domain-containing protein [Pseudoalteromonas luteoviolacea]|uniref:DUF5916 domain-containing protein n=1 Tax=Pseudoalteromonas luteoviolacea NCIMB 1942 TaxID=1365253 RepID=A0A167E8R6_9GAMM|nr:DUF5916 domain-containing protein [Pseudoalteromonas luteoviolacea]KZN50223.1 hypothetical protein N482_06580 [Pseudoalteromonas luteoviolacea NCIMB 1942]
MSGLKRGVFTLGLVFGVPLSYAQGVQVDGKLDELAWQSAADFLTFFQVVPATHTAHKNKVTAKVLATEEGIYIGIINYQPENQRKKQFNLQDGFMQGEFNRIYLDFSGDGSSAYLFATTLGGGKQDAVVTPQRTTDMDWDGDWESAFDEQPLYWSNEVFVPWHSVSFSSKVNADGFSTIGVGIQLYDLKSNNIFANQKQTIGNSDFFLNMPKIEVSVPQQSQLNFVPYVSYQRHFEPRQNKNHEADVGFDLFYKPAHHQTLSFSVNPDFAQVDSDDVDVNYSAVETLRTDKRPFFTQDISVFSIGALQDTKLIHTRRIGAGSDDKSELITPIDGAVRFVHQGKSAQWGAFAVKENSLDSGAGKDFYAGRFSYRSARWQSGILATHVERPWLKRNAQSVAWDSQYQDDKWSMQSALLFSQVDHETRQSGNGISLNVGYQFTPNTQLEGQFLRLNDGFENRDMGYMKRNDWQYSKLSYSHAVNVGNNWLTRIKHSLDLSYEANSRGLKLPARQGYKAQLMLNNGAQWSVHLDQVRSGWQDNIGANSAPFFQPSAFETRVLYQSPYTGEFSWAASVELDQEGLSGDALQLALDMTWMPHANWNIKFNNYFRDGDGWLVASQRNQLSEYDRTIFINTLEASALITENLEFSSTFQWSVLEAKSKDVYDIVADGLHRQTNTDTSFEDTRMMSQFKLRYRMGAYSDVYLVYRRGGEQLNMLDKTQVGHKSWLESVKDNWTKPIENSVIFKVRYLF